MTSRKKTRSRTSDLADYTLLRRSPRLSSRRPRVQPISSGIPSHNLYRSTTQDSLNSGYSRSATPSTILDESGQSVPPSFDGSDEDDDENVDLVISSPQNINAASRIVREVPGKYGMPRHLYGLDSEDEVADVQIKAPLTSTESPRLWNVYDKERFVLTAAQPPVQMRLGFFDQVSNIFTSLLFKLGSLLYLASTTVMCLDVIILHRLFNFNFSSSQRTGTIARFFFLTIALCTLVSILLGANKYEYSKPPEPNTPTTSVPVVENDLVNEMRRQFTAEIAALNKAMEGNMQTLEGDIQSHQAQRLKEIMDSVEAKDKELLEKLRMDYTADMDAHKQINSEQFSTMMAQVDSHKVKISVLNEQVSSNGEKISGQNEKMSVVNEKLSEQDARISAVEDKYEHVLLDIEQLKKSIALWSSRKEDGSPALSESLVVQVFNDELRKAISNDESALGQWLANTAAAKDDVTTIRGKVDNLMSRSFDGANVSRQDIEEMINISLQVYGADRIGSYDFVLENAGGSVMLGHCSQTYSHSIATMKLFGFSLWHFPSSPKVIIQPSLYPGDCWAMEGQSGFATIKTSAEVVVTGVTLDHIPKELTPNGTVGSAPKDFTVIGLTSLDGEESNLGSFSYDINGPNIQTYSISDTDAYQYVKFKFTSNHGNEDYTCIYRVRVHGHY